MKYFLILTAIFIFLFACNEEKIRLPKQRMYPYVQYPHRKDTSLALGYCKFTFNYPTYFKVEKDKRYFKNDTEHPCWFNLYSDTLNSTWHFSYIDIKNKQHFDQLINDSYRITESHNTKANARKESIIHNTNGVSGVLFNVDGPVASPTQFFITDSTKHFLRASLYFNAKVNPDSTAPVLKFLNEDLVKMIESFKFIN